MDQKTRRGVLWHAGKALLCALQLYILDRITELSVGIFLSYLLGEGIVLAVDALPFLFIRPTVTLALFFAIFHYYDGIDDRSFNRYCDAPYTLRDKGAMTEWITASLASAPILTVALHAPVATLPLPSPLAWVISAVASLLLSTLAAFLRIRALLARWSLQKDLRRKKDKPRVLRRVLYAVIYFVSLCLLVSLGFSAILPTWGVVLYTLGRVLLLPIVFTALALAVAFFGFVILRGLVSRRKFLRRLERLREAGELTYIIHGHPYLSLFSQRIDFGLTIVDSPHPEGKRCEPMTYKVAVASCGYRRMTIVLCDNHVYRFMYSLQFHQIVRFGHMGASMGGVKVLSIPGASFFTNHSFVFPEGEGERILLIDPTPYILALQGFREGELIEQDNASHVFDYTVYGKNAFLNILERT